MALAGGVASAWLLLPRPAELSSVYPDLGFEATAPMCRESALHEIEQLGQHPWAGEYRTREGWPFVLTIAPQSGFTLYKGSSCGLGAGWRAMGKVLADEGSSLKLAIEAGETLPVERRPAAWCELDETLYLVPWGDLLFAVPTWSMERFCERAREAAAFPYEPFRYLGNDATFDYENAPRPNGLPQVPAQFQGVLASKDR